MQYYLQYLGLLTINQFPIDRLTRSEKMEALIIEINEWCFRRGSLEILWVISYILSNKILRILNRKLLFMCFKIKRIL